MPDWWLIENSGMQRLVLIKPPEVSRFNFGAFSLAVLAAAVRDIVEVRILDATGMSISETVRRTVETSPDWIGITTMALSSLASASNLIQRLRAEIPGARLWVT